MQKTQGYILAIIFLIFLAPGCAKNVIQYGESTNVTPDQALLKINYESMYALNPGVQVTVNGTRVSPLLVGRTPFPGGGYNTMGDARPDYLAVPQGEIKMKISIPQKGTNVDSVVLYNYTMTLEAGKYYTAHVTDTAAKTEAVLLNDDPVRPDSNFVKFRFLNLMPNVPAVDLYYGTTVISGNIAYKSVSNYIIMPVSTLR